MPKDKTFKMTTNRTETINVTVSEICPFMEEWPFFILGLVLNIGVVLVPIIWFYFKRTNPLRDKDRDLFDNSCKIVTISKSWRNRLTVTWVLSCASAIATIYNMCVKDVYVYVLIDLFVVLLILAYFLNPEEDDPTIPVKINSEKELNVWVDRLSKLHLAFAGLIFVFIPVVEGLTCGFYYGWNNAGIALFSVDVCSWILFFSLYLYYERYLPKLEGAKKTKKEWSSATACGEIIYCLMFGFTMMFVGISK